MIPFLKPNLVRSDEFQCYLKEIEDSNIYSNFGPLNTRLEKNILRDYFSESGAVSTVNNATSGLMLSMNQLKRNGGKYALMPSFTFAATPLAAMWAGLEPYFLDVDLDNFCISNSELERAIEMLGESVAIVVPYAAFGHNLDLKIYEKLVSEGTPVVIDAASSFGNSHEGITFGKGFHGAVVYSFHATKSFGIGEGGLIYSANIDTINHIRDSQNFGFNSEKISYSMGLNAKLPEILSAVGLATMKAFPEKRRIRAWIYDLYIKKIKEENLIKKGWSLQKNIGDCAHQFFPILSPKGISNTVIKEYFKENGIEIRTYFSPPCHLQPTFNRFSCGPLSNTIELSKRTLSLPLWEQMTENDVSMIVKMLNNFN